MPSLFILVPLLCLLVLNLPWKAAARRLSFGTAFAFLAAQAALSAASFGAGRALLPDPLEGLFVLAVSADALTWVVLFCVALVAAAALAVGRSFFSGEREGFVFANLVFVSIAGMNGAALTSDLFTLYVFIEVTSIASFILVAFRKDLSALEGAFKYLILSAVATVLMLSSVGLFVLAGGGTSFAEVRAACAASPHPGAALLASLLFVAGLFIKAGVAPFHWWLPDAYGSAPSPVSVLLAGIVTKATGVYGLVRLSSSVIVLTPGLQTVLMAAGLLSIYAGALAAVGQTDFKRLLAYSSISQVGYIVLALGVRSPLALAGAVFHLLNHAVFKSLLFVNAAAVESRLGTTDLGRMGGLGSRMPVTAATSVVAMLSTAGIPPLAGFWSKLLILLALWQSGFRAAAVLALLASLLTLGYFLLLQRRVFFGAERPEHAGVTEAGAGYTVPQWILAALTVGIGVGFPFVLRHVILPLQQLSW